MQTSSIIALLALGACVAVPAGPDMSPAEAEALYTARFERLKDRSGATGLPAYDNLKPVAGTSGYTPLQAATDPGSVISGDTLQAAISYADANNSSALIIWKDGEIISETYFGDNRADTLLVSKSLAKPLGVIAVGRAIADGYIGSIDDAVADYITEWQGTAKDTIRVRDLLSMHSGLLAQRPAPEKDDILNKAYLHPFHEEIIINDYPLVSEPGTTYAYSNATGDLVAPLIERATGKPYETWLADEVFGPLGAKGGEVWMNRDGGTPHAGCCILLPADTYLRLGILLVEDGVWRGERLLTEDFVEAMKTPGPDFRNAGMGLYLGTPYREWRGASGETESPSLSTSWHSSAYQAGDLFLFDGNSNQVVYMVPSEKLVILRTGARPPAEPRWDNAYLPNLILQDMRPAD